MFEAMKLWFMGMFLRGMEEINEEVDDILADFHERVERLEAVRDRKDLEASEFAERSGHMVRMALVRQEEAAHANKLATKMKEMFQ